MQVMCIRSSQVARGISAGLVRSGDCLCGCGPARAASHKKHAAEAVALPYKAGFVRKCWCPVLWCSGQGAVEGRSICPAACVTCSCCM
jgi:hypothetical protein